jgi:hypothetical protein
MDKVWRHLINGFWWRSERSTVSMEIFLILILKEVKHLRMRNSKRFATTFERYVVYVVAHSETDTWISWKPKTGSLRQEIYG